MLWILCNVWILTYAWILDDVLDNGQWFGEYKMMLLKLDKALYRIILGCGIMLEIGLWFGNSLFQIG